MDNPEYYPTEAIHRSHELMDGNKWKWVKLQLSFIGWIFLSALPSGIYQAMYGPVMSFYYSDVINYEEMQAIMMEYVEKLRAFNSQPIPMLLALIPLLVTVYMSVANAAFYDLASGNLVVQDDGRISETAEVF